MSKQQNDHEECSVDDVYDQEISDEDYGFIVGPDGELKSVFTPVSPPFATPESVVKILQMFGISDLDQVEGTHSIH